MNLSKIYQTAIAFNSIISICVSSSMNAAGSLRGGSLKEENHGVLKLEIGNVFGKEMTYDCQMTAAAAIDEAYKEVMDDNQGLKTHLEAATIKEEEDEAIGNDDMFLQRRRWWRYGIYNNPYRINMWIGYTGGYGCRMCGGSRNELENNENEDNHDLIESLGNKHDAFQEKVKDILSTAHCDAFANITLVNIMKAANPLDAISPTDGNRHIMNPQIANLVPTSKYGVDAMRPLLGLSMFEGTMLKKVPGVLKMQIDHVFGKVMTYDCQTIAGAAIAEAYTAIMDGDDDLEVELEETIFIDEKMDNMVEAGELKSFWASILPYYRTFLFIHIYMKKQGIPSEDGFRVEESVNNYDLFDRLGNKHDDFQKKVFDILLNSHCGAFANITLVDVSDAMTAEDDLELFDDRNRDINIKID